MDENCLRILLVEDNPADARLLYEELVERSTSAVEGFMVVQSGSLGEALEQLIEGGFDAVLLDLSLPDSQALETVRRAHLAAAQTPIIVLTGLSDEAVGIEAVREGAQDYLVKGQVARALLVRSIKYAIERQKNEEALARYRDHLEELVSKRTAALAAANASLQKEVAEHRHTAEELRVARAKLVSERERQSRLLAADLHDSVGQELIALKMSLEAIGAEAGAALGPAQRQALRSATEKCISIIREMRHISHGLYPPTLESFGVASALRYLAGESRIPVTVYCAEDLEDARFPAEAEICLFRIAQEALTNAMRHSQATKIDVHLAYEGAEAVLTVIDNGVGFELEKSGNKGLGLLSMSDRIETCSGKLGIISKPGETRIEIRVPALIVDADK